MSLKKLLGLTLQPSLLVKPVALGGSLGRDTATAQGSVYVLDEYLKL